MAARETSLLLILGFAGFATTLATRSTEPMGTRIAAEFAVPIATTALLSTSCALPFGLCQPVFGALGDAFGKSRVLVICTVLLAMTLGLGALAPSLDLLFASRVVVGLAAGGIIPLSLATIGDRVDASGRQVAIGRFLSAVIIGQSTGVVAAGVLVDRIGWRCILVGTAAVAAAAAVVTIVGLKKLAPAPNAGGNLKLADTLDRYALVFRNPRAAVCYAAVCIEGIAIYGCPPYVAEMVRVAKRGGPLEAGIIIAGIGLGGMIFSVFVVRILASFGPLGTIRGGGLLAGLGLLAFALAHSGVWVGGLACFVTIGLGFFMLHSSLQSRATELAPAARASALALHAFFYFVGQGIAPILFGFGYRSIGATPALGICAAMMAATGFVSARQLRLADLNDREPDGAVIDDVCLPATR